MALSFANVKTILRSRLSEAAASAWTDDELQDYLYLAEQEVLQLLPSDAFWDIQEVETTVETPTNGYVALPTTALMQQITSVGIAVAGDPIRLRIIEPSRASEYAATTTDPVGWFQDGNFYFSPRLNPSLAHGVTFRFVPGPTEGAIIVPDRYISLVVSYAYALAIAREDNQEARAEKNEFYQRIGMINEKMYNANNLSGSR